MRERGSALLTAVVAVMVLLLISGIIFSFVNSQFKMQTTEEKALKAYYLADAGTSYGIAEMFAAVKNGEFIDITKEVTAPFGDLYGGFKVEVTVSEDSRNLDTNTVEYTITAKSDGYYPSIGDRNRIVRTITKEYFFTMNIPEPL